MKWKIPIIYILIAILPFFAISQVRNNLKLIEWTGIERNYYSPEDSYERISLSGAVYNPETSVLPSYFERVLLNSANDEIKVSLKNKIFEEANAEEVRLLKETNYSDNEIQISTSLMFERKIPYAGISFIPIRKNSLTGKFEKLVSFNLNIQITENLSPVLKSGSRIYPDNSVLATGDWYKLGIGSSGMYKITYEVLSSMGINPGSINPKNIKIYGNGGGMLPEANNVFRYNDLQENAIIIVGEDDGSFDSNDYILFYAESSDEWILNEGVPTKRFEHEINLYSDLNYYFLTISNEAGKRISTQQQSTLPYTVQVNEFLDYKAHEIEDHNLIKSGKDWFGEKFDNFITYEFPFNFPNIINNTEVNLRYRVVARSKKTSYFKIYANGNLIEEESISPISDQPFSTYAYDKYGSKYFSSSSSNNSITITYTKTETSSVGWLDYIELNAKRNLIFTGGQMSFRNPFSIGNNEVSEFILKNATQSVKVLNITDPIEPRMINTSSSGNNLVFKLATDSLLQFIAYDGSSYFSITNFEKIENQNLHAVGNIDMLIIYPGEFHSEAERLAQLHRNIDNYEVFIVTPQKIYNEFSSGRQDVTAIKDFIKMFYDRAEQGDEIQYVIFFGDASYDYKDRIIDNTNLVPTWETKESLRPISSIASDDYFAFLDDNEGTAKSDNLLDVSIGRFPLDDIDDIKKVVDKTELYIKNNQQNMGDWRNVVCFVADDEENNRHFDSCEKVSKYLASFNKNLNIDKIYLDAYPQVSTPGGERYPEVTDAINNRMEKGNLIMNYMGHGGEVGWAHERVLNVSDIINWKNLDKLSVFITATCEFSRYDDPERVSAGELVINNPNGGAVSMFTTARPTNIGANEIINKAIYKYAFDTQSGTYVNFGDIMRHAKNENGITNTDKMYVLFGDPAIGFAIPKYSIKTTKINTGSITEIPDTLKALSKMSVEGSIFDNNGNKLENYSGILYPIVYDKPTEIRTLGQGSDQKTFYLQNSILYKGKAKIENGDFSFSFVVPKDIAYNYGFGKISYYANNNVDTDACGYYDSIVVGGNSTNIIPDSNGPDIELYMNDENFVFGGITDQYPYLLAFVTDSTGINTVGSGIGHDIVAILDNNSENQVVLNEYYESDINSYQKGRIVYPFRNLTNGRHTLNLKVWDVNNNSSKAYTEFIVAESEIMALENLMNYPNPFKDKTSFIFEHNQANSDLNVEIQIFSLAGELVKTITTNLNISGFRSKPIEWYGTSDNGASIARGMYVYKVKVSDLNGKSSEKVEKLVILK